MKEKSIVLSGEDVRAILSDRKTQMRPLVKSVELGRGGVRGVRVAPNTFCYIDFDGLPGLSWRPSGGAPTVPYPPEKVAVACPFGQPGDRLWVRETWGLHMYGDFTDWHRGSIKGQTEEDLRFSWEVAYAADARSPYDYWRSPTHMPRWASRITLEVTGVHVERLWNISEFDAIAEGVEPVGVSTGRWRDYMPEREAPTQTYSNARESFFSLWESVNGTAALAHNPWCWAISFRRLHQQ